MSKGPRQLEFHEQFMLDLYCKKWQGITKKRRDLKRKAESLDKQVNWRLAKHYLKHWRQELYLKDIDEHIAYPHFETKVNLRIKTQVFEALF